MAVLNQDGDALRWTRAIHDEPVWRASAGEESESVPRASNNVHNMSRSALRAPEPAPAMKHATIV